jgi:hypothetical protein
VWIDGIGDRGSSAADNTAGRRERVNVQKSFWGGERKFLEPLMHFTRDDARDHTFLCKLSSTSSIAYVMMAPIANSVQLVSEKLTDNGPGPTGELG